MKANRLGGLPLPFLLVWLMCGCEIETTCVLHVGELHDVATGSEGVIQSDLKFQVPVVSTDNCEENIEKFTRVTSGILNDIELEGCKEREYIDFLVGTLPVPIWNHEDRLNSDDLFAILATSEGDSHTIRLIVNESILERLNDNTNSEFSIGIDLNDMTIRVELTNDRTDAVIYEVNSVYVDDDPIATPTQLSLSGRTTVNIELSDVMKSRLASYKLIELFSFDALE